MTGKHFLVCEMAEPMALVYSGINMPNGQQHIISDDDVVATTLQQQTTMETAAEEIPCVLSDGVRVVNDGGGGGGSGSDGLYMDENSLQVCGTKNNEKCVGGGNGMMMGGGGDGGAADDVVTTNNSAVNLNKLMMLNNSTSNNGNMTKQKAKRRRRKSKAKTNNVKPYKKTNWKFQVAPRPPLSQNRRRHPSRSGSVGGGCDVLSTLVPYNTNKFLMEEHMPELPPKGIRTRDSSFSMEDSAEDNNYFNSLPEDEEEFLTKEFSNVYEDARSERLDGMTKNQLIREYLQMEANYDKLSQNLGGRKFDDENAKEQQLARNSERESIISRLEDRVKELNAENLGKSFALFLINFLIPNG